MIPPRRKQKYTNLLLCGCLFRLLRCVRFAGGMKELDGTDDTPATVVRRNFGGQWQDLGQQEGVYVQ